MEHTRGTGGRRRLALAIVSAALLLGGCGGEEETEAAATSSSGPQISGTPPTQIAANQPYSFTPTVSGANGSALQFEIANRPSWLTFTPSTGQLSGTPTSANVGTYRGITIQVSDGRIPSTLPAFDIQVLAVGSTSATLSWMAPTHNEDGSPLTDLAGYRIRYGGTSGSYPNMISVNTAGVARYVVDNLAPGKYYFVLSSVNSRGVESRYSNEAVINL